MEYKYYVHDDDGKILDKEFDNFPDAFDYAQDGLYTYIDRVSVTDEDDYENVWTWDDTRDREEAIRDIEALNAETAPVEEQVEVDVRADSPEEFRDFSRLVLGDNHEFFDSNFEDEKVPDAKAPDVEVVDTDFEPEFAKEDEPIVEELRELDPDEINTMLDEWAKEDAKEYAEMSLEEFLAAGEDLGIKLSEGDYYKYDDYYSEYAYMNSEDEDAEYEDENLDEDTHAKYAKPGGNKVAAYNNALKYAKQNNVPYIYGYVNATQGGKFFALDQPIKVINDDMIKAEKEFRNKYKSAATIYAAYPDKNYVKESLEELNKEIN